MKGTFRKSNIRILVMIAIIVVYFSAICLINFSAVPGFYDADMYCDYRYTEEAWAHRSIFPEGWVFGNQLNAVSTPVLAALIYGLSDNLNFSMAAACTIMAVVVVFCFAWMIKPAIQELESRLVSIALLITVVLYCGTAVRGNQGWTLLFTMCSYYAGYSITAFLAFGCYLRGLCGSEKRQTSVIVLTCILSFGTGIQSIRQTAIMVAPMLAVEFLRLIVSSKAWKENKKPLWVTMGVTISNVLGLCYVRMREINQNQIFGKIEIAGVDELKQAAHNCFSLIKDPLGPDHPEAPYILAGICIVCAGALILLLKGVKEKQNRRALALALMIGTSVIIIIVIDVFTTMYVRPRYYFMLYPLVAYLIAYLYDKTNKRIKWCLLAFVVVFFLVACVGELPKVCSSAIKHKEDESYEISEYLLENGYTTIYAEWNVGHDVAIASNGKIDTGYWYVEECPFEKVTHLCSLDIYDNDPGSCVYLFVGEDDAEKGISVAESVGVPLEFLCHYPESNTYLYTASSNLMQIVSW